MRQPVPFLCALLVGIAWQPALAQVPAALPDIEPFRAEAFEKWDEAVAELEDLDATESHPDDSILFIGSSSVRGWASIGDDMAPYHPIRRGYGGAQFSDLVFFAERLTAPHRFRALVIFVANDIHGSAEDKSPSEVAALLHHVVSTVRASRPEIPIFQVAITPTTSRWAVWPASRAANHACQKYCEAQPNAYFIPTESAFLDADGQPRSDLFIEDQLHLSEAGYDLWAAIIKSHLDAVLGGAAGAPAAR